MIDHVDVIVQVTPCTIRVCNHEVICRVHPFGELYTEFMHTLHVLRIVHVELLRREVLRIRVHLVAPIERGAHLLGAHDDRLRRLKRARHQGSTSGVLLGVLIAPFPSAIERVAHC